MIDVRVLKDSDVIKTIRLGESGHGSLRVGREEGCDVVLQDRAIGREHFVLSLIDGQLNVQKKTKFGDLSINGTKVHQSEPMNVALSDQIQVGNYQFKFEKVDSSLLGSEANPSLKLESALDSPQVTLQEPLQESISENSKSSTSSAASIALEEPSAVVESAPQGSDAGDKTAVNLSVKISAKLIFAPGIANTEIFEISKSEVSIGRGTDCDIVLNDKKSSRKHAILRKIGSSYHIQDLGSGNGIYVNENKVSDHELSGNDIIRIGDTNFKFEALSQEYFEKEKDFANIDLVEIAQDAPVNSAESAPPPFSLDVQTSPTQDGEKTGDVLIQNVPEGLTGAKVSLNQNLDQSTGGIPGIQGSSKSSKKETLLEKFKRQPPIRKAMIVFVVATVCLMAVFNNDDEDDKKKNKSAKDVTVVVDKAESEFNTLTPEKKQFVMNTYQLANDLYKNLEYSRALFEVKKIFDILPNGYKDSKDLKVYAEAAIDKEKSRAEEKRRKEEDQKIKADIEEYLAQAQAFYEKGRFEDAKDVFSKVLEKDPENATVSRLKRLIEEKEQQDRSEAERKADRDRRNRELEALVAEGRQLLKEEKFYSVIDRMVDAPIIGSTDQKLLNEAVLLSKKAQELLKAKTKPFLDEGESALLESNFLKARDAFIKASQIDVRSTAAQVGLKKIRQELNQRSKRIYTDAVILESLSDYNGAKLKFRECLENSMPDDIYHDRCERKVTRYSLIERTGQGGASTEQAKTSQKNDGQDPEKPELPGDESGEKRKPSSSPAKTGTGMINNLEGSEEKETGPDNSLWEPVESE